MNYPSPEITYCPTLEAREKLAKKFNIELHPCAQDWEWEVADYSRIDEFFDAYKNFEMTNDEKFTLMEMMIQSFEDSEADLNLNVKWKALVDILDENFQLHQRTVWYWACFASDGYSEWSVTPYMTEIYKRNV